jgi:putative endonuclease
VAERNLRREGAAAEDLAAGYLRSRGYAVIERNFHFGRKGEIDIIAREGGDLVFCEVKSRTSDAFGPPECAVTARKQQTIRRVAHAYLYLRGIWEQSCRFDVVTIRRGADGPVLELFKNAF